MTHAAAGSEALRLLLAEAIDYAGLFPPAEVDLPTAVGNYAAYRSSADAWALGRFIIPASMLERLSALSSDNAGSGMRLSVVLGPNLLADGALVSAFAARYQDRFVVDAVEARTPNADAVEQLSRAVPATVARFAEVPQGALLEPCVAAVRATGAAAKIRTGGVTPDAFPSPDAILAFLRVCHRAGVSIKATAGLHHPLRGDFPLTYAVASPCGRMYGYLNLFLAAAAVHAGHTDDDVRVLLLAEDRDVPRFGDASIQWGRVTLSAEEIAAARRDFIMAFGSCSFREPLDELAMLRLA